VFDTFYQLSGLPFMLTPDSRFFFGSSGHSRAIAHLVYGLSQQEGFIVITGEVGAGKTTLVEQLWAQLDRNTYVMARVVTTQVSGDDLLRLVMANFGVDETPGSDKATLLRRFEQMVREQRSQGRRCLLVVDEVQNLSLAAMEELRMLSNITVDGRASVQTILLGQPQFRPMLASRDVEQLRQRVLASYHLGPLTEAETRLYIEHRLRTVGWQADPVWDDTAFSAVHRHSGGIPRRINTLCSRVLLFGALEEAHVISGDIVDSTALELDRDLGAGLAPVGNPFARQAADVPDAMLGRIEALERIASRQEQAFQRVLTLLEAGQAGLEAGQAVHDSGGRRS
jgi:putative secretion ATPase (PEP-CTERM system associated)